jgi:hypothetical protein
MALGLLFLQEADMRQAQRAAISLEAFANKK